MKLTNKDLDYFEKRCKYWYRRFSLYRWELLVKMEPLEGAYAEIRPQYQDMIAVVVLADDWTNNAGRPLNRKELDFLAKHEIIHLLIQPLVTVGEERFMLQKEYDRVVEETVLSLERLIP